MGQGGREGSGGGRLRQLEAVVRVEPGAVVWKQDARGGSLSGDTVKQKQVVPPEEVFQASRDVAEADPEEGRSELLTSGDLTYPVGQRDVPLLADDQGRYWLPLLPGVRSITWKFYQLDKKQWIEESEAARPPLIELTLMPYERNAPIRRVFAIY